MGSEICELNDVGLASGLDVSWVPTWSRAKDRVEEDLGRMEVGETIRLAGKVVCRWSEDEWEVVSYGRRHFRLRDAATMIVD